MTNNEMRTLLSNAIFERMFADGDESLSKEDLNAINRFFNLNKESITTSELKELLKSIKSSTVSEYRETVETVERRRGLF